MHRYLSFPSIAGEPPIQLKGFQKTKILSINESITITLLLNDRDVSIWNVVEHHFSGEFVLYKFIVFRALPSTIKIFISTPSQSYIHQLLHMATLCSSVFLFFSSITIQL